MKHTDGPWKVALPKNKSLDQKEDRLIHTEDGRHIAETFQYQSQDHYRDNGSSIANANLIAAAPELLEALDKIVTLIRIERLMDDNVSYLKEAKKAIKKAKGDQ